MASKTKLLQRVFLQPGPVPTNQQKHTAAEDLDETAAPRLTLRGSAVSQSPIMEAMITK